MSGNHIILKYRMPRSSSRERQAVILRTMQQERPGTMKQETVTDDELEDEGGPGTVPEVEVKYEFGSGDEEVVKQENDRSWSVLGKRPRPTNFPPASKDSEEEEEEVEDYPDNRIAESPMLQPSTGETPGATAINNPKVAAKSHQSRYVATRKRYKHELKRLPDPKHLAEYARAADYEACKNLSIFLGEEFEHEDQTRIETVRKLRKANTVAKDLKKEVAELKTQIREARTELWELKQKLKRNDTAGLQQSLSEAQIKLDQVDVQHKQDLVDLQAKVRDQKVKQTQALLMAAREKEMSEKLGTQLKVSTEAREGTEKQMTDLKYLLAGEMEERRQVQSTVDELTAAKKSLEDEIQTLKAEVNKMTEANVTSEAANEFREAILQRKCQKLETEVEMLNKKYEEQKGHFDSKIDKFDKLFGDLRDMRSQG